MKMLWGLALLAALLAGCAGPRGAVYSLRASREFGKADEVHFTDLRPGHREELMVRKKELLQVLSDSVRGAELVDEPQSPVVGKIELLEGGRVLGEYRYHLGGTLESAPGRDHVVFRPLASFHPALFVGSRRDWFAPCP